MLVAAQHPLLRAARAEFGNLDPRGLARGAIGARGAIDHILRAPEALLRKGIVQRNTIFLIKRGKQLSLLLILQIRAGLRRSHIKLRMVQQAMAHKYLLLVLSSLARL